MGCTCRPIWFVEFPLVLWEWTSLTEVFGGQVHGIWYFGRALNLVDLSSTPVRPQSVKVGRGEVGSGSEAFEVLLSYQEVLA